MKRVAVVEDNPDNLMLVAAILGDEYEIAEYENGPDALEGMLRNVPDLVLLDISLPGMDGVEVLRRLRDLPSLAAVPVVALTAHAMVDDRQRFLQAGFDGYLAKPILDEEDLFEVMRAALETRS